MHTTSGVMVLTVYRPRGGNATPLLAPLPELGSVIIWRAIAQWPLSPPAC
jgi:hypothetical protein